MEQRGAKTAVSPAPLSADLPDSMTHEPRPTKVVEGFDLDQIWPSLVDNVGRASQFTRTYLLEAHPISFAKGVFTIGFPPETEDHIGLVDNARNHSLIQAKLGELGIIGVNHIKFIKSEARLNRKEPPKMAVQEPAAPPASTVQDPKPTPSVATARSAPPIQALSPKEKPTPTAFSQDDFKNDPLIQKALEIFKGQIVEYRA